MAQDVLSLWRSGEGTWPVGRYLNALELVVNGREDTMVDVEDLPAIDDLDGRRKANLVR